MDSFGGVCPSMHVPGQQNNQINSNQARNEEEKENQTEKFCLAHPQKKTKYFCETD